MLWLTAIIFSYLFFALASLGDKIVLAGPSKPKTYTFLVGALSLLSVLLIPFVEFGFPSLIGWGFIILEAIVYVAGLYAMFYALDRFDVSKVISVIGATQPIIIALLTILYWGYQGIKGNEALAFVILLTGSALISVDKNLRIDRKAFFLSLTTAVLFSLDFVFTKFIYNEMPFWQGFIWMRIVSFVIVLFFFLDKGFRKEIKEGNGESKKRTGIIFIVAQMFGGLAGILQSLAISLVPVTYLAIMNSMKGIQYAFLFILVVLFSIFLPRVLKEEMSKRAIIQKIISILLIGLGLAILVL